MVEFSTDGDSERTVLATAIVVTALAFGFVAGFQVEHAISGEPVDHVLLVTMGGGFLTTLLAYSARGE